MYSLYNNALKKQISLRLSEKDYDKLIQIFENRNDQLKIEHRNISEFLRYIILSFLQIEKRKKNLYQNNYFENNRDFL